MTMKEEELKLIGFLEDLAVAKVARTAEIERLSGWLEN